MGAKTRKLSQINDSLIEWQSVVVADGSTGLTAEAGRGYFINTTGGAITVTLPSATAKPGDTIQLKDYARTWGTNNVNIASTTLDGATNNPSFSTNGQTVTLIYMDNTRGWSLINEDTTTGLGATFISATGGTITTSGDFKIHSFTGDGCFVVSTVGNPAGGGSNVDYLVIAGGGGGGGEGGGGGAGGYRFSNGTASGCYSAGPAPLGSSALPVSVQGYPITVGAGGAASTNPGTPRTQTSGGNSIFSTITSTGGGFGGSKNAPAPEYNGSPGGSGGGVARDRNVSAGSGNSPPTSPPQGNPGGTTPTTSSSAAGGGGGAGAAGSNATNPGACEVGGPGGVGLASSITGSSVTRGGGGGGGSIQPPSALQGTGGTGGGGNAAFTSSSSGTINTGGGGGGYGSASPSTSGTGGKGIVVIRYKFQ